MRDDEVTELRSQLKQLQRRLRREVPPGQGLSRTQVQVLRTIDQLAEQAQPSQVATELQMTSSNVAAALRELADAGLIARQRDPDDARRVRLAITDRGTSLIADFRRERDSWLGRAVEAVLTEQEQQSLLDAGRLLARLSEYEDSGTRDSPAR
jgi:DNA-binding MarR family transcriptional regulator